MGGGAKILGHRDRNCPHIPCNRFFAELARQSGLKTILMHVLISIICTNISLKKSSNNIKLILMNVFKV